MPRSMTIGNKLLFFFHIFDNTEMLQSHNAFIHLKLFRTVSMLQIRQKNDDFKFGSPFTDLTVKINVIQALIS